MFDAVGFDAVGSFTKAFTPTDGGYIFFPSAKSGGKFVTTEEYENLSNRWQQVAGRSGRWKTGGIVFLAIFAWTALSQAVSLPPWADVAFPTIIALAMSAWLLWASLAPRRLVRDRPDVTPPRAMREARRAARSALNWRFILFCLLFSGAAFWGHVLSSDRSLGSWLWIIGGGAMFVAYLWIGFRKLTDN